MSFNRRTHWRILNRGGNGILKNWQTYYHIENWRQLAARPFLWCKFVWCMFDFSAAGRREGTTFGRNDKGLVTYDRRIRKDAYIFIKPTEQEREGVAYCLKRQFEPMIH